MEVLSEGYLIPFHIDPPLSDTSIILDSYSVQSIKGRALEEEIQALRCKGAVEPAPLSPGYYSHMVTEASGGWRPIIDFSTLNLSMVVSKFRMETAQSVLCLVQRNDWMVTIDLKDAYLQIPIYPQSRKFLRFTTRRAWQLKVLCLGLSTAPQVFTWVIAPVSGIMHLLGVRMLRYLDDWLIMASSRQEACWARDMVLQLCQELGIIVNLDKSSLLPSQSIVYLGIQIELKTFRASPTPSRIEKFLIVEEFLSSKVQSAKFWRVLLGHLASFMHIVPGGQLQMRALQLALKRGWNFQDDSVLVPWDAPSRADLLWWCEERHLEDGVSVLIQSADHMFWSDASDQEWGTAVADQLASGLWLEGKDLRSINHRELLAVERGLFQLQRFLKGHEVTVFSDTTTAVAYLRSGRYIVTNAQRGRPADPSLGGVRDLRSSAVCSREEQCGSGCSVSSQPGGGDGVDSPSGGLRLSPQALACDGGSFCVISQSPLWCLFCFDLGSYGCGDGCHPAVLGFP